MRWERDPLWAASPRIRALYRKLATAVRRIGPFDEKPTKVSISLVRGAVFLTVEPQLKGLRLTVKSEQPIKDPRILRTDHMTRTRWHNDFKLAIDDQVDSQALEWIRASYALAELVSQPAKKPKLRVKKAPPSRLDKAKAKWRAKR